MYGLVYYLELNSFVVRENYLIRKSFKGEGYSWFYIIKLWIDGKLLEINML